MCTRDAPTLKCKYPFFRPQKLQLPPIPGKRRSKKVQLGMPLKIGQYLFDVLEAVFKKADHHITSRAQEAAHLAGRMVMVYGETAIPASRGRAADCAAAPLLGEDSVVAFACDAVTPLPASPPARFLSSLLLAVHAKPAKAVEPASVGGERVRGQQTLALPASPLCYTLSGHDENLHEGLSCGKARLSVHST
jgi:hypothetical protein